MRKGSLNAKVMNALVCILLMNLIGCVIGLRPKNLRYFRSYARGHKLSKRVQNQSPIHQYGLFIMENDESIKDMFSSFVTIINGLKSLEKAYPNIDLVNNNLRSLPKT